MKKIIIFLLLALLFSAKVSANSIEDMLDEIIVKNNIASEDYRQAGSSGYDWLIFANARYKKNENFQKGTYLHCLSEYIKTEERILATDYARFALVATSLGDYQLAEELLSKINSDLINRQGLNGYIWTLIALDSNEYSATIQREDIIKYIIDSELENGGYTYYQNNPEVDMTAMVIVSLAPYYHMDNVKEVIDRGMEILKKSQYPEGYFENYDVENAESTAWAVLAATALNIDPTTYYTYNIINGLLNFYNNGSFTHTINGSISDAATYQGLYALVGYLRYMNRETSLFDLTDTSKLVITEQEVARLIELETYPVSIKYYDEVMGLSYLAKQSNINTLLMETYQNHKTYLDDINKKIDELLKTKNKKEIKTLKQQIDELPEYDRATLNDYSDLFTNKPYWLIPVVLGLAVVIVIIVKGKRK